MKVTICLLIAALGITSACYDPNAHQSKIVREVEAAGAGDLSTYNRQGLAQWFYHHQDVAIRVAKECEPIAKVAPANWNTTAEGTICTVAPFEVPPPPNVSDTRSW
jgi:hypothetical protein